MTQLEEEYGDEHFEDFEADADYRELVENPTIDAFNDDSEEEPIKTPKKKKTKKKKGTDLKVYDAGDDTDEELSNLKHDISEAPPSARILSPSKPPVIEKQSPEPIPDHDLNVETTSNTDAFITIVEDTSPSNRSTASNSTPKSFKKKKKSNSVIDTDTETQIIKLKEQNQELKMQLLELNNALDEQLSKKGVKIEKKRTVLVTSDKEMKNLMKQVEMYKKENEDMKRQLYTSNDAHRIVQLENKLQESKLIIDQLNEEKKSLQTVQRKQGKALEDINSGNDKTIDTLKSDITYLKAKIEKLKEQMIQQAEVTNQKEKMLSIMENKVISLETIMKEANVTKEGLQRLNKVDKELEEKSKLLDEEKRKREIESKSKQSIEKKFKLFQQVCKQDTKKLLDDIEALKLKLEEKDRELRGANLQLKNNNSITTVIPVREPSPTVKSPTVEQPKSNTNANSKIPKPNAGPKSADSEKKPPKPAPSQQQRQPKVPTRSKSKIPSATSKKEGAPVTPSSTDPSPRMIKTEQEKSLPVTDTNHQEEEPIEDMDDDFIGDDEETEDQPIQEEIDPIIDRKPGSGGGNIFKPMF